MLLRQMKNLFSTGRRYTLRGNLSSRNEQQLSISFNIPAPTNGIPSLRLIPEIDNDFVLSQV
jgi:hypothetical protein